ncbi:MAG: ABC-F family ATP-binding cassette domain-containing protein [Cyanobacteriota bacterium]|nr:ABC-F family ATP-binding cassette domain-containing protein [Cyanobacteriota bacterium]
MALITARALSKDFGIKEILREASFTLEPGERVGLIGANGSGKSTLLKMLAGLEPIDKGELSVNSGSRVIYLPQEPDMTPERTVLEQVFADSGEKFALVKEYESLTESLAREGDNPERLSQRLSQLSEKMTQSGAWELEAQAKIILHQLGIERLEQKVGELSGGYRKRIAIAAALLAEPDALLMDEPTNHLDAGTVEWLQSYLQRFRGALLLITHDRYFLDQVTNRILEIDRGDLYAYSGNYAHYLEQKALAEESQSSSQRKHSGVLRRELAWLRRGPKARSTKQKARIDRIEDMREQTFKEAQGKVEIATASRRIGKKVIELQGVSKALGGRRLIEDFSYIFTPRDRVGIVGKNGAGKSTLMNLITGRETADAGTVEIGATIQFGYFDQQSEDLYDNPNQRVIEYLKESAELVKTADGEVITASQMLERFLFSPNQQYAPLHKLSGGERRRLFLLRILIAAPNVLILDEPTNDLDIQTLGVLEDYLENFNGCVIVVSHDRYFLDRTVETIFAFEGEGKIKQYPGNYSVYLDYLQRNSVPETAPKVSKSPPSAVASKVKTPGGKLSFKEKREYEELERNIPQWEAEKKEIEVQLYAKANADFTALESLTRRLGELTERIEQGTERWLELAERS